MTDSRERLSAHFTLGEMIESGVARRDPRLWRQQCKPPEEVQDAVRELARRTLQPLRDLFGWPILVNSGYRCLELNRRIGGVEGSQHCRGQAADIRLAPDWSPEQGADQRLRDQVSEVLDGRVGFLTRNGWLFAVATILIRELEVDQVIHEYGDRFGAPAWVHISHGPRNRRKILAIGEWTGGVYRTCTSLADLAREAKT